MHTVGDIYDANPFKGKKLILVRLTMYSRTACTIIINM
jgi:hypothetical protein